MDSAMSFEYVVVLEGFFTFTALERSFLCVSTHVALQMPRGDTTVVALVTFEWLFSSVIPHHVLFQMCLTAEVAQSAFISQFSETVCIKHWLKLYFLFSVLLHVLSIIFGYSWYEPWDGNCLLESQCCPWIIPHIVQELFSVQERHKIVLWLVWVLFSDLSIIPPKQLSRVSGRRSLAVTASKLSLLEKESSGQPVLHLFPPNNPTNPS